jgi:exopolysaccharide biosynthesis polyprenyl glycosylphosphotransferase
MLVARKKLLRNAVALLDAATLAASFAAAYFAGNRLFGRGFASLPSYAWVLAISIAIWLASLGGFGLYRSATYTNRGRLLWRLIQVQFIAGLVLLSAMFVTKSTGVSRLLLQTFVALSFVALTAQKFALRACLDRIHRMSHPQRHRILLVVPRPAAERYLELIKNHVFIFSEVIGIVTPPVDESGLKAQAPCVLGVVEDIPALMEKQVVDEVIVASSIERPLLERLSQWCATRGVVMRLLVEAPRTAIGLWTAEHFGDGAFLLSLASVPQNAIHLMLKRVVDIAGAALGLLACSCAYLWYGPRLRRETGDSVIFRQRRVGWNGRRFTLYKFRTMHANAEQLKAKLTTSNEMRGPVFKIAKDPRVTPTGRKLRRRHLDELPQFWNILKGEMSLVGTRPPTEDEVAVYSERHHRRLSMKPGLTGLWQLRGNGAIRDFEDVVKLDFEYIDNWSLWLDLRIIARTVTKVMRGDAW